MDAQEFKQRFLPLHPKLYRMAYALLGNKEEAEDILQEVYCKLWNHRHELDKIANAEAFAVTIVKHLCTDFLRSSYVQHSIEQESLEQVKTADNATAAEQVEEARDAIRYVQQLITLLPAKQQQVLRLHSIEGCSMKEVSQLTGLSDGNIRTLLSRARKFLREHFKER